MTTKARRKMARCAVCGGELRQTTITHEETRGEHIYLFEHVPAQVCPVCGELGTEETTLHQIDRLIKEGTPV
jgi:YgiT-type zinc finger domain-containing protein